MLLERHKGDAPVYVLNWEVWVMQQLPLARPRALSLLNEAGKTTESGPYRVVHSTTLVEIQYVHY